MTRREELQAIMDAPGFGTGMAYRDRKAQEAEALALLPDRAWMAPVMATTDAGSGWLICSFGNSSEDGMDWHFVTDRVRASMTVDLEFPDDAKMDALRVAAVLNAFRLGRLVVRDDD